MLLCACLLKRKEPEMLPLLPHLPQHLVLLFGCLPPPPMFGREDWVKLQGISALLVLPIHCKEYHSIANRVLVSSLLQISSFWAYMMYASLEVEGDVQVLLPIVLTKALLLYVTHFCVRRWVRLWGASDTVLRFCHFTLDGDNTTTKRP